MRIFRLRKVQKSLHPLDLPVIRVRKWLRRLLKLFLLGALLAFPLGNLLLNLPPAKAKLTRLVSRPGQPVEIGRISYWPWSGLRMHRVRVGETDPPLLETEVRASVAPLRLLGEYFRGDTITIDELRCHDPKITLLMPEAQAEVERPTVAQTEGLVSPGSAPLTAANGNPEPAPAEDPDAVVAPSAPDGASAAAGGKPVKPAVVSRPPQRGGVQFGKISVLGGEIVIRDGPSDREMVRIASFELDYSPSIGGQSDAVATVRAGEVSLLGFQLAPTATADITVKSAGIEIRNISIPVLDGAITGIANVYGTANWPFQAQFGASGLSLSELPADLTKQLPVAVTGGEAGFRMRLRGYAKAPGETRGRLFAEASGMSVRAVDSAGALGRFFSLDDSGAVAFEEADTTLDFVGGTLLLSEASLRSGATWIKAAGEINRRGTLRAVARIYGAGDHLQGLERMARARRGEEQSERGLLVPMPGTDWRFHDFLIAGAASRPQFDFWNTGSFSPMEELLEEFSAAIPAGTKESEGLQ